MTIRQRFLLWYLCVLAPLLLASGYLEQRAETRFLLSALVARIRAGALPDLEEEFNRPQPPSVEKLAIAAPWLARDLASGDTAAAVFDHRGHLLAARAARGIKPKNLLSPDLVVSALHGPAGLVRIVAIPRRPRLLVVWITLPPPGPGAPHLWPQPPSPHPPSGPIPAPPHPSLLHLFRPLNSRSTAAPRPVTLHSPLRRGTARHLRGLTHLPGHHQPAAPNPLPGARPPADGPHPREPDLDLPPLPGQHPPGMGLPPPPGQHPPDLGLPPLPGQHPHGARPPADRPHPREPGMDLPPLPGQHTPGVRPPADGPHPREPDLDLPPPPDQHPPGMGLPPLPGQHPPAPGMDLPRPPGPHPPAGGPQPAPPGPHPSAPGPHSLAPRIRVAGVHSARMAGVHSARVAAVHSARVAGVHSARVGRVHSARVAAVHSARVARRRLALLHASSSSSPGPPVDGPALGPKPSPLGLVALVTPLSEVDAAVRGSAGALAGRTALALLLAALALLGLLRGTLRPLERMAQTADEIRAGDRGARMTPLLPGRWRDEAGRLATAFDRMLDALVSSEAEMRRFLTDASHELRTPITVAGGYADVLLGGAGEDPATRRRALLAIRGEVDRMARLVTDLLMLARLDGRLDRLEMRREPVPLLPLLADVAEQARLRAPNRTVTLAGPDGVCVVGDPDRLRQVFANLADNVLAHTCPAGRLEIEAAPDPDAHEVHVCVRDDGPPIPQKAIPSIFHRFVKGAGSSGSGLGLAIVHAIVEAHGGQVEVRTDGPGNRFTITLPQLR